MFALHLCTVLHTEKESVSGNGTSRLLAGRLDCTHIVELPGHTVPAAGVPRRPDRLIRRMNLADRVGLGTGREVLGTDQVVDCLLISCTKQKSFPIIFKNISRPE